MMMMGERVGNPTRQSLTASWVSRRRDENNAALKDSYRNVEKGWQSPSDSKAMLIPHLLLWWSVLISITAAKTCSSMDVRNRVEVLVQLSNCEVIEGFLQVVLIDHAVEEQFNNYSFPLLREVTEYVIFFRVEGLRSIGSLFPNLSVIRGEQLAMDYALIINELSHLTEINLPRLVIKRGAVSIGKNAKLCFATTIDWDQVAAESSSHLIFSNGETNSENKCPSCKQCTNNRCWNSTTCQIEPEWKSPDGYECDKQCLGGCSGQGPGNCTACKHVRHDGKCIVSCPNGTYVYKMRYCLSKFECLDSAFHRNLTRKRKDQAEMKDWFTFNGTCIQECPHGYERQADKGCKPCGSECKKVCSPTVVDSLQSAQSLKDCTFINGSLSIQITSGKASVVAKELETNLGKIEEIATYLKIARSPALNDLNFLKNLRVIHGPSPLDSPRSLIVIDNPNLQEIWDWEARPPNSTFKILRGRPFFHHNPKLCLKHITRLTDAAGLKNLTEIDVASASNGDQFPCQVINLTVSVHERDSTSIVLYINKPLDVTFIRYTVYHKKATSDMTSPYGGDECSDFGWNINDVLSSTDSSADNLNTSLRYSINRLEPDTLYAFYVSTYTVESKGGQTPLQYFRTLPSRPGMPTKFMVHSNSSNEIVIRWDPPLKPNGKIKNYIVSGELRPEYPSLLEDRNYCMFPVEVVNETRDKTEHLNFYKMKPTDNCCDIAERRIQYSVLMCEAKDKSLPKIPLKIPNDCGPFWYDLVANTTIPQTPVRKPRLSKRWANFDTIDPTFLNETDVYVNNKLVKFIRVVDSTVREIAVKDVKHFTKYVLSVIACRERIEGESPDAKICSQQALEFIVTQADPTADDISGGLMVTINNSTALLSWQKPSANGAIVSYHIELHRTNVANAKPLLTCVPTYQRGTAYEYRDLPIGDYRVRMRAMSLAGPGKYTNYVFFSISEYSMKNVMIVILVILTLLTVIGSVIGAIYYRKYKQYPNQVLITSVNPEYCGVPFDNDWELPRSRIKIVKEIQRGNFGVVCEGLLSPDNKTVAVKRVIESASSEDVATFLNEAAVMKRFANCHHIVKLIGVVSKTFPQLVVMEMMAKGDLRSFLRNARDNTTPSPTPAQMCLMAAQIADGMAYLEAEKFVHRDLAARNCMVSSDNVVKIGDFGMTRDIYETDYYRKGSKGLLPVRWMAPESLNDGVFSTKSDVWSYGVVLWEMITLASQPYQTMTNEQVIQYVISGNKLELPPVYPKRFKAIMNWCWKWKPKFRPSFIQILMEFEDYMTLQFKHTAYYYTVEGAQAREACLNAEEEVELSESSREAHYSRSNGHSHAN